MKEAGNDDEAKAAQGPQAASPRYAPPWCKARREKEERKGGEQQASGTRTRLLFPTSNALVFVSPRPVMARLASRAPQLTLFYAG
jgi:hypothetical protein